ncbi:MAG TPA: hypothetical protein VIA82_02835 [Candidatus Limnocylindria bacterium]|jgi:hypothetical protein
MQQRSDQPAKQSRLRRLKGLAVATTAGLGMLIWGAVSGTVVASDPVATDTLQPVTQDTTDDSTFFGAQGPAPGLSQTNAAPMTRSHGS